MSRMSAAMSASALWGRRTWGGSLEPCRHFDEAVTLAPDRLKVIQDLDIEVNRRMGRLPAKVDPQQKPLGKERNPRKTPRRAEPVGLRHELYRTFGVDLTQVPGINPLTAQVLLTEVGPNLDRFPTASAFSSWLRLCPEPRISGGKVLSSKTRPTKNRAALALRLAAQALHRSQTFLGDYFRRMKARLGPPAAITAVAHKLARIVYHLITTQQEYDVTVFQEQGRRTADRKRSRLYAQARELGLQLTPVESVPFRRARLRFAGRLQSVMNVWCGPSEIHRTAESRLTECLSSGSTPQGSGLPPMGC
jgi:hypothetical protein